MNAAKNWLARTLAGALLTATVPLAAVEIVAHRGASHDAPENTLAAMKLAWTQRADGIETDLHLSRDGHLVVLHDADTLRVSGVSNRVAQSTWAELKDLDVGSWKGPAWTGEKIPTLDAILATIPDDKFILLEIKVRVEILPALEKVLRASGKRPVQLRIITFHYETARAAKERFPAHEVYWLVSYKQDATTGRFPELEELIARAEAARLDGLDLDYKFPIDGAFVKKVHAAGLKLHVWTVDDPQTARTLRDAGVDGITTNRPEFLRRMLQP
ncbi:MAG TPA: glycerophosphodiester phosphodiesterase [Methylomirabilota bacterium]|nr:glycerophosphodiester phosphodiesterase [Methylomirabilota bacterium]